MSFEIIYREADLSRERRCTLENPLNTEEYIESWYNTFNTYFDQYGCIEAYCKQLLQDMRTLVDRISSDTFWELFPHVLGIDARLALLGELIDLLKDDNLGIGSNELIAWVEKDYPYYTKELCGYNLNSQTNYSLIFQVK